MHIDHLNSLSHLEMPAKEYPHKRPRTEASKKEKKYSNAAEIRFALRADNQESLIEGEYERLFFSFEAPVPMVMIHSPHIPAKSIGCQAYRRQDRAPR